MSKLKKFWPSIAHVLATGVVFLDPAVQTLAASHPAYAAPIVLLWGFALHAATAPRHV